MKKIVFTLVCIIISTFYCLPLYGGKIYLKPIRFSDQEPKKCYIRSWVDKQNAQAFTTLIGDFKKINNEYEMNCRSISVDDILFPKLISVEKRRLHQKDYFCVTPMVSLPQGAWNDYPISCDFPEDATYDAYIELVIFPKVCDVAVTFVKPA